MEARTRSRIQRRFDEGTTDDTLLQVWRIPRSGATSKKRFTVLVEFE
jgi:hypothetical protein